CPTISCELLLARCIHPARRASPRVALRERNLRNRIAGYSSIACDRSCTCPRRFASEDSEKAYQADKPLMIRAVIFDLDNTLVDFMAMKRQAIDAAVVAMIDAGLDLTFEKIRAHIDQIYQEQGIEYQRVFDQLLQECLG